MALVCLAVAALMCLGMGGLGEREVVTKIPRPDRFFNVEVVDVEDVSFSLREFSMDGLTLLPVTAGKAQISLDFAEITEARFYLQGDRVQATVTFKNGSSRDFFMEPDLSFFGLTDWGKVNLEAGDIRRITFKEQVTHPPAAD
ncbi:MAG TPA: hypothetical protein ENN39_02450 [Desulfonatronum sp.]|nr:hypothetical protein [Desulfonatronum sp.]